MDMANVEVDAEVQTLLRRANQRYTTVRQSVVRALEAATGPMTITQILETDSALSQSSVYRNLTILEQVGAVTRIITRDDFARYELAEQLTGHHHHLICSGCGNVQDFSLPPAAEAALDTALAKAASNAKFEAADHRLDLIGTCNACA